MTAHELARALLAGPDLMVCKTRLSLGRAVVSDPVDNVITERVVWSDTWDTYLTAKDEQGETAVLIR